MNRQEVIEVLKKIIPSFSRDWTGRGGTNNKKNKYGFLYYDHPFFNKSNKRCVCQELPYIIPSHYLEGITISDGKEKLVSTRTTNDEVRKIGMHITSFAGYSAYEHTYGTLNVSGVKWTDPTNGYSVGGYIGKFIEDPNFDSRVERYWEIDLCRIITQEDFDSGADWNGWYVGDANQRFVSESEMFLTACFVCLERIEGPFMLKGNQVYYEEDKKKLIEVDKEGNVKFFDFFFQNLTENQKEMFKN